MKKILFMILGIILLIIGLVGFLIPVMPSTPFLLLASACFMRSSERVNLWFKSTKIYKRVVLRFLSHKGMTLKTKLFIIIPIYIMLGLVFIWTNILLLRIFIIVLLTIKTIVFIKIKTIKEKDDNIAFFKKNGSI